MRRSIFGAAARPAARSLTGNSLGRRAFATPPTKDTSPPSPIDPSKEQAHPIGPFYESILRTPQPIPERKPEVPPKTATVEPAEPPKPAAAPTPAPIKKKEAEPAAAPKQAAAPTPAPIKKEAEPTAAPPKQTSSTPSTPSPRQEAATPAAAPAKRTRNNTTRKAKSVTPTSSDTTTSTTSIVEPPEPLEPSSPPSISTSLTSEDRTNISNDNDPQSRARVVFGSRLVGPAERAERLAAIRTQSRLIAGVLVPPKPEEPDNCCMSGCVNCVWDRFRDDMEEWAAKSGEAERRLRAQEMGGGGQMAAVEASMQAQNLSVHELDSGGGGGGGAGAGAGAVSMDDDGGGSFSSGVIEAKDFWDEELYKNVPVGIREFMKQEKRLKEKHLREGSMGG